MSYIRKLAAASLVASAVLVPTAANAGTIGCTLNFFNVPPGETVNCYTDTVGFCTFYYDPFASFPSSVAPETTEYAFCLVF